MRTLEPLTFHGTLSNYVVEELCVAGVHPTTAWTRHYLLLGVAAQVLPKLRTPFSGGFAIFPSAAYWEFTVSCWYIYTQAMHLHMAVEPLWVFIRRLLTFLPEADKIVWNFRDDVAVVVADGAAANLRLGVKHLLTQLLQLSMVTVKEEMSSHLFRALHRAETAVFPETVSLLLCFFFIVLLRHVHSKVTLRMLAEVFHQTERLLTRPPLTLQLQCFLLYPFVVRHLFLKCSVCFTPSVMLPGSLYNTLRL